MKYLEYREKRIQGTFEFPVAYYHIDNNHPRYHTYALARMGKEIPEESTLRSEEGRVGKEC